MPRARRCGVTAADLLALVLYAAARDTLETQPGARRIRACGGDVFNRRTRINTWAQRVREHINERIET